MRLIATVVEFVSEYFYSHTSYEVRPVSISCTLLFSEISTHTPHTRCDIITIYNHITKMISTHTPHTRCDDYNDERLTTVENFYSHTSYEVRRVSIVSITKISNFYSHTSYEVRLNDRDTYTQQQHFYSHTSYEVRLN